MDATTSYGGGGGSENPGPRRQLGRLQPVQLRREPAADQARDRQARVLRVPQRHALYITLYMDNQGRKNLEGSIQLKHGKKAL